MKGSNKLYLTELLQKQSQYTWKSCGKLFHQEWQHSVAEETMREETIECRTQLGSANRRLGMNVGQWSHCLEHLHPIFQPQLLYFWTNFPLIHNLWGCRWWLEYLYSYHSPRRPGLCSRFLIFSWPKSGCFGHLEGWTSRWQYSLSFLCLIHSKKKKKKITNLATQGH